MLVAEMPAPKKSTRTKAPAKAAPEGRNRPPAESSSADLAQRDQHATQGSHAIPVAFGTATAPAPTVTSALVMSTSRTRPGTAA